LWVLHSEHKLNHKIKALQFTQTALDITHTPCYRIYSAILPTPAADQKMPQ